MNILKLSDMTTHELMLLFTAASEAQLSPRAKKIIEELEKRGYIFDPRHRDFITGEQWNIRHGAFTPMDCDHWPGKVMRTDRCLKPVSDC